MTLTFYASYKGKKGLRVVLEWETEPIEKIINNVI